MRFMMRLKILLCWLVVISAHASNTLLIHPKNTALKGAFIVFYLSTCPHCKRFAPVLKRYATQHHIPVLAYTLDGQPLFSFPGSVVPNRSELQRFFPNGHPVVPTLYWIDQRHHIIVPVLKGEATTVQLSMRMQQVYSTVQEH